MVFIACKNENTYQGEAPAFNTSVDTLMYDTVFTAVGSVTQSFKIYNKEDQDILVDIALEGGDNSPYRLNINGTATNNKEDLLIRANDSIYVFVDVTIDPDQPLSVSPFFVKDSIKISSAQVERKVMLTAFGQNANYLTGTKKGRTSYISCDLGNIEWNDPKPYVIYGILYIDNCNLIIPKGTNIYVHGGVVSTTIDDKYVTYQDGRIAFLKNGSITSQGTVEEPVIFRGDRLEDDYDNLSGQWYGMQFLQGSKNNSFEHTIIKNSTFGMQIDGGEIKIKDSKILNTSANGIEALNANLDIQNSLIANNGAESMAIGNGGTYTIIQSTIANYGNKSVAFYANNYTCDVNDCQNTIKLNPLNLTLKNNIIVGDVDKEFAVDDQSNGTQLNLDIRNNLLRTDQCNKCIQYNFPNDKLFVNYEKGDYHLDSLSIATDKGINSGIPIDIDGKARDEIYDLGCYESTFK